MQGRKTERVCGRERDEFSHVDGAVCSVSMNITPLSVSRRDTSGLTVQLHEDSITFVNPTSSTTSRKKKKPSHIFEMVWNNPPFLPRHVTRCVLHSRTARRYTHSRGVTVTVSSKFRSNGTHGECVGNNATIRSWETTAQQLDTNTPQDRTVILCAGTLTTCSATHPVPRSCGASSKTPRFVQQPETQRGIRIFLTDALRNVLLRRGLDRLQHILQKLAKHIAEDVDVHVKTPPHSPLVVTHHTTTPPVAR